MALLVVHADFPVVYVAVSENRTVHRFFSHRAPHETIFSPAERFSSFRACRPSLFRIPPISNTAPTTTPPVLSEFNSDLVKEQ